MPRGEFIVSNHFELRTTLEALKAHRYSDPLSIRPVLIERLERAIAEECEIDRERQDQGFRAAND